MLTVLTRETVGRVWRERRFQATFGWVARDTTRDGLGQPTQVSEWEASPTHWTKYLGRDPFGRPTTIRPPDGSAHDVTFTYTGERLMSRTVKIGTSRATNGTINETPATTTEEYDGQLRLWKVTEPAGGQTADYRYDVGQRLSEVRLTQGVNQYRYFTYDNRGFMTSEQHPETGVITYSRFDARGHAGRMQRGPNDLTTTWDRAERVTQIRETSGQQRVLKEFTYATSNAGGGANLRRGKLITATRHNWIPVPWAGGAITDVTVTENYTYEGRGGRLSQRTTAVSTGPTFSQGWTYTDFGDVENLTYPRCTQSSCTTAPTSGSPRTVTFGYTRAELSSVSGYASSIDYHPSGLVNTVAHSNGVNEITDADPDGMRRPEEIRTTGPTSASLGVHRYDGAGNVVARGAEYYLYDLVSRLVRYNTTTSSYQTYGYDTYGNMTSLNFFNGSTTTARGFAINAATNQLSGAATYDTAGNLTSWGGHTYGYDAFNMQTTHDFPDWVQLYTADDERIVSLRYTGISPIEETYTLRDLAGKALTSYKAIGGNTGTWYWEKDYVYRDGLLLAAESSEPWPKNQQHYVVDHLGTPRLVTGANGSIVAIHHYFGFGEEIGGGSDPERLRFTGHERDFHEAGTEDDLDYMHARYCSPQLARFMSVDPINSAEMKVPQSWNRYAYARGNPTRFVDPDGQDAFDVLSGVANSLGSNQLLGGGRVEPLNHDFAFGQAIGDVVSILIGVAEAGLGGGAALSGTGCAVSTLGACAPAAAGAVAAGSAAVVHGAAVAVIAGNNLSNGVSLSRGNASGSTGSSGDLQVLDKRYLEKIGLKAEKFKQDLGLRKDASKFNLAVDKNGQIVLVPVKKGASAPIPTGIQLDDLINAPK
ncbi:MAG: RHS repeat-associated core domain-containing protein [Thermoanaerobaculia bacterium]|nr:RHS repeat-associated core domain-containing protein [Thermoanaerobaculia bacterium]